MSLFQSLFPLARENALTILVVAEGDQLRVNVMPKSKDEQAQKTLYPLSLLGSPEELDRDFAEAVQIYSPGSQSVLDQARAAGAANGETSASPALPAPAKGKPGRKPKAAALPAPAAEAASDAEVDSANSEGADSNETAGEIDPRQMKIDGLEGAAPEETASSESAAATSEEIGDAPEAANAAAEDDGAVDLL